MARRRAVCSAAKCPKFEGKGLRRTWNRFSGFLSQYVFQQQLGSQHWKLVPFLHFFFGSGLSPFKSTNQEELPISFSPHATPGIASDARGLFCQTRRRKARRLRSPGGFGCASWAAPLGRKGLVPFPSGGPLGGFGGGKGRFTATFHRHLACLATDVFLAGQVG